MWRTVLESASLPFVILLAVAGATPIQPQGFAASGWPGRFWTLRRGNPTSLPDG